MCDASGLSVYTCPKVANAPVIDGRLDDEAWKSAEPIRLVRAETGEPVTRETTAWMCWDDRNLYIAFDCIDQDIWGTYTKHDDYVFNEEVVEAFICPTCKLDDYFELNVTPRNVTFDGHIRMINREYPPMDTIPGWECEGWQTAVIVDGTLDDRTDVDKGWTVEMAIPFASLDRKTPIPGERWRMNLFRIDLTPTPEYQAWSPTMVKPARFHVPERFGTVLFSDKR